MLNLKRLAYDFKVYAKNAGLTEDEREKDLVSFMSGAASALKAMDRIGDAEYLVSVIELLYKKQGFKACEQDAKFYEAMCE